MSETQKKTLGIAIASMVCSLFFIIPLLGFLLSIAASILGIIALVQISKNKEALKGNGFAIAGIVLGCLGVVLPTIVEILASLAIPRFIHLKQEAQKQTCEAQVGMINIALSNYYADRATNGNEEPRFPASVYDSALLQYFSDAKLPVHPWDSNWDDYYDSQKGQVDMSNACAVQPSSHMDYRK